MENAAKQKRMARNLVDGTEVATALLAEIDRVRRENVRLRAALEPFADAIDEAEMEAHEALQVGGYVPVDMDDLNITTYFPATVTVGHLKAARAALVE